MTHLLDKALQRGLQPDQPLRQQLEKLGVSDTRINAAVRDATEQGDQEAFLKAVRFEKEAEKTFVEESLWPWANRHDLTLVQAVSILSNDSTFNPETGKDDLPTQSAIWGWHGQTNGFLERLKLVESARPAMSAERASNLLNSAYSEDPLEALSQIIAKLPPSNAAEALQNALKKLEESQGQTQAAGQRPSP